MQLRRLGPGDETTAEQACRVFGPDGDINPSEFLARPATTLIVAEEGLDVVGWINGHELPPSRRLDHARASGCTEVWVLTDAGNPAGIATYGAAGGQRDPATR